MICGFLMKYVRADPSKGIAAGGTKGIWNHFGGCHSEIKKDEMPLSSHSNEGRKRRADIFSGGKRGGLLQYRLR